MDRDKTGTVGSSRSSESTSGFYCAVAPSSASAPPIPAAPPPVSPIPPRPNGILGTSTQRHWTNSSTSNTSHEMSASVQTTVREWSTPIEKYVEGVPPKPEDNPMTYHGELRSSKIRTVTPSYKVGAQTPGTEIKFNSSTNLPEAVGDYKVKESQDHFKLEIIDPKVSSNARMPPSSINVTSTYRKTIDFPSEHSKRSFQRLEPIEQRRMRSVERRPITTSKYLTESLDRHREMEASRLKEYLKAKEGDANKPWDKPGWPGPKEKDDRGTKELEEIKKTIETLQQAALEPKKNSDLDQLAQLNEKLTERSKGRRADYKIIESEIIKTAPEPVPPSIKEQIRELLESRVSNATSSTLPQQDRSGYATDVSSATWQFSTHSFSPRSVVSINGGKAEEGLLRVHTDLSPEPLATTTRSVSRTHAGVQTAAATTVHAAESEKQQQQQIWPYMPAQLGSVADSAQSTMTREFNESYSRRIDRYASLPTLDGARGGGGTLIKVKEDKPRSIMKRRELETKDQMMYVQPRTFGTHDHWEEREVIRAKPKVTETVQKFEERTRTEEVERRVQRKERKEKKHRSGHREYHHGADMITYGGGGGGNYRSSSANRQNGYLPAHESYTRSSSVKREREGNYIDDGRYHQMNGGGFTNGARHGGSLSDSLRRGDAKYIPNGEIREVHHSSSGRNGRVHKSYSNRDVFDSGNNYDSYYSSSYRRGSQQSAPLVEFPPTLPRDRDAPIPPPHRNAADSAASDFYRPVAKSRSYADWDDGRGFGQAIRRRDEDLARVENEFRDSLLMPLPNGRGGGNVYEKDHRHEQIPGGYETYDREVKSNSGRRFNREGNPTDFSEASHEYSYKRETDSDRRR